MSMLQVVLILLVVGVLLYLFNRFVTAIDARVKTIINWFVIICIVVWILNLLGVFALLNVPIPRVSH
jgi:uncharacterized protein involved in cysteine biosynthesis